MVFDKMKEYSIEDIKVYIKDFLHGDINFEKINEIDIYKMCAALEECLREQIIINKELLSSQKSIQETNQILIKRINMAINELEDYDIDFLSIRAGKINHNDNIVYNACRILKDGLNGKNNC